MQDVHQWEAALAATVPGSVREVCARLAAAGHEAVTVGGAVRDVVLGRVPGDWDVATSALPQEVMALFPRTVPTGIAHGTITVLMGPHPAEPIEVTTYRGEGAYSDARRPDAVHFGVPLVEDLARRDLVVNAIAYDPTRGHLIDPFDGLGDIRARRLRAVGDPVARFVEDGLRVMRAVRFAATLEFALDEATASALTVALPSLAKVARERVWIELQKLLAAPTPSRGLVTAYRYGVLACITPRVTAALARHVAGTGHPTNPWCALIDAAPAAARCAAYMLPLVVGLAPNEVPPALQRLDDLLRELTVANRERELTGRLVRASYTALHVTSTPRGARELVAGLGREAVPAAVGLWNAAMRAGWPPAPHAEVTAWIVNCEHVVREQQAVVVGDLAIKGADLVQVLGIAPGPALGRILRALLDDVLDTPAHNERGYLLATAERLIQDPAV